MAAQSKNSLPLNRIEHTLPPDTHRPPRGPLKRDIPQLTIVPYCLNEGSVCFLVGNPYRPVKCLTVHRNLNNGVCPVTKLHLERIVPKTLAGIVKIVDPYKAGPGQSVLFHSLIRVLVEVAVGQTSAADNIRTNFVKGLDTVPDLFQIFPRAVVAGINPVTAVSLIHIVHIAVRSDFATGINHPLDKFRAIIFCHPAYDVERRGNLVFRQPVTDTLVIGYLPLHITNTVAIIAFNVEGQ